MPARRAALFWLKQVQAALQRKQWSVSPRQRSAEITAGSQRWQSWLAAGRPYGRPSASPERPRESRSLEATSARRSDHCDGALATGKLLVSPGIGLEDEQLASAERTSRTPLAAVLLLKFRWPNRRHREGSQALRPDSVDQRCRRQLMDEECPKGSPSGGLPLAYDSSAWKYHTATATGLASRDAGQESPSIAL